MTTVRYTGFASPAEQFSEKKLDLNAFVIRHPAATFFMRMRGDSHAEPGIRRGDVLVVDRSQPLAEGKLVVASVEGELKLLRIGRRSLGSVDRRDVQVLGVVTCVLHFTE